MTRTCFKIRTVCYHQHDHFFCNQLFLALTNVTDVALTDASVKVGLYKRCTFCPVFFAVSTTEEAAHSLGEVFGDQKRNRLVCGKLLKNFQKNFWGRSSHRQCRWIWQLTICRSSNREDVQTRRVENEKTAILAWCPRKCASDSIENTVAINCDNTCVNFTWLIVKSVKSFFAKTHRNARKPTTAQL